MEPEAMIVPKGEKRTQFTPYLWPTNGETGGTSLFSTKRPSAFLDHILMDLSFDPETRVPE